MMQERKMTIKVLQLKIRLLGFVLFLLGTTQLSGQQMPTSNLAIFNPSYFNPGFVQSHRLADVYIGYQHRHLSDFGWRTMSQFVSFKGKTFGKGRRFGVGFNAMTDWEHTERRLDFGMSFGVKLLETEVSSFSVGFKIGLINIGANYTNFSVYDRSDPLVSRPVNFAELDAGLGFSYGVNSYYYKAEVQGFLSQLPGNLLSAKNRGMKLYPHFYGGGSFLLSVAPDVFVGPQILYRNILTGQGDSISALNKAEFDVGLKVSLDRSGLWFGGAWRMDNAAVTGAFGMNIAQPDTFGSRSFMAYFSDVFFAASYPLNESSVFGPSLEVGLQIQVGRVGQTGPRMDTLGLLQGAFWLNNGNMSTHYQRRMKKLTNVDNLYPETFVGDRYVDLRYEFDDNQYKYIGLDSKMYQDTLIQDLGYAWIGMDSMVNNIVAIVIDEALFPTMIGVEDPDSVEPMKALTSLQVGCRLRFSDLEAEFGAEGVKYNGEFGYDVEDGDTLSIRIRYNERDTTIKVGRGGLVSNLELSALKVYALHRRLEYEVLDEYSNNYYFINEGDEIPETEKTIVEFKLPIIIPNNPNQKPFQVSFFDIGMVRFVDWEPEAFGGSDRSKNGNKGKKKRGKRARNKFREKTKR